MNNISLAGKTRLMMGLALFASIYPQAPLYTENQNTKFLHGAARAGLNHVAEDWTANTVDPLPVFTALVEATYQWLPTWAFHIMFGILVAIYAWSALGIVQRAYPGRLDTRTAWIFAALFAILHFTSLNDRLLTGVAGQYLLEHYLQPCVFGVLVVMAIRLLLDRHRVAASLCLAVAVAFHPGAYLIPALLLLAVMLWLGWQEKTPFLKSALPALVFATLLAPLAIHMAYAFSPTSPEIWQQAIDILSNQRIPHHTKVDHWLNASNIARLAILILACWMVRGNRVLFAVMSTLTGFVLLAILALLLVPDAAATFSTPWRVTAVAVPLSVVIVTYRMSLAISAWCERRLFSAQRIRAVAVVVILAASVAALNKSASWLDKYTSKRSTGVIHHARMMAGEGQMYLIPPRHRDFNHFRLEAGMPVLANWKSHPYRDVEVIEWYERIQAADRLYSAQDAASRSQAAQNLIDRYSVTHLVVQSDVSIDLPALKETYVDRHYRIYQVQDAQAVPVDADSGPEARPRPR